MLTCLGKLCLNAKTNTIQKEQLLLWRWTVVIYRLHHIPHSFTAAQPATAAIWYRPKQPQRFSVQLRTPLSGRFYLATAGNRSEIHVFHQHVHFFCEFRHFDAGSVEIFRSQHQVATTAVFKTYFFVFVVALFSIHITYFIVGLVIRGIYWQ